MDSLWDQVKRLDRKDQATLLKDLELFLEQDDEDTVFKLSYEDVRNQLMRRFEQRYPENLRPWGSIGKMNRKAFTLAWKKAVKSFKKLGFSDDRAISLVLVKCISRSSQVEYRMSFKAVLEVIQNAREEFDAQFPNYSRDAIKMIESAVIKT